MTNGDVADGAVATHAPSSCNACPLKLREPKPSLVRTILALGPDASSFEHFLINALTGRSAAGAAAKFSVDCGLRFAAATSCPGNAARVEDRIFLAGRGSLLQTVRLAPADDHLFVVCVDADSRSDLPEASAAVERKRKLYAVANALHLVARLQESLKLKALVPPPSAAADVEGEEGAERAALPADPIATRTIAVAGFNSINEDFKERIKTLAATYGAEVVPVGDVSSYTRQEAARGLSPASSASPSTSSSSSLPFAGESHHLFLGACAGANLRGGWSTFRAHPSADFDMSRAPTLGDGLGAGFELAEKDRNEVKGEYSLESAAVPETSDWLTTNLERLDSSLVVHVRDPRIDEAVRRLGR